MAYGPSAMTERHIFSRPARPNSVNKHFIIWAQHFSFSFCFCFLSGNKNRYRNIHLRRSFWPKSRDYHSNKVVLVRISCALFIKSPYEGRTRSLQVRTAFSGPARAIAYGPHTGIFSIVLQWKRARGRTGHIIIPSTARASSVSKRLFSSVNVILKGPNLSNTVLAFGSMMKWYYPQSLLIERVP